MSHTILHADSSNALEMLDRAVRLRAAGGSFDLALALDDDRGSVAAVLAQNVCRTHPEVDNARCAALDIVGNPQAAIGQNPLLRFATMDVATKATMRDLAALADRLLFRSWAEMRRGVMNFDIVHRSCIIVAPQDARVPKAAPRVPSDGSILIWAPDEPVERLFIVLTAAAQTGRRLRVVAKPGELAGISAEIITSQNAGDALARAAVCVVASPCDPSAAVALAAWNIPMCATFTSGVHEWIGPACSYRSWSRSSALAAITQALAMPAPTPVPRAIRTAAQPELRSDALVTIVVRSHKGQIEQTTQRSIDAQPHQIHELVVCDSARGVRDALAAANGRYILFLNDGDILFCDHLAALVDALEHSQSAVGYCGGVLACVIDAPGPQTVLGYSVMEKCAVSPRSFAAVDAFAGTTFRILFRRDQLQETSLDADLDELAIIDGFARMLSRRDAVHVDRVGGMSLRMLDGRRPGAPVRSDRSEYEAYYRARPAPDAAVSAARAAVLRHLSANSQVAVRPPPQRLSPPRPF